MPDNYSTTEIGTGYVWVDGKKIYKKTISLGTMPNNSTQNYAHNISDFGGLVDVSVRWHDTIDNRWYSLPRVDSDSILISLSGVSDTNILIKGVGTNWSARTDNVYATIWYTKSA